MTQIHPKQDCKVIENSCKIQSCPKCRVNNDTIALLKDHIKRKYAKEQHPKAQNASNTEIIQKFDTFQNIGCLTKGQFNKQDKGAKCLY